MRGKGRAEAAAARISYASAMPDLGDAEWGGEGRADAQAREGLLAASLRATARALEREQDRWFLWLPVLFAAGIVTYFALADEPGAGWRPRSSSAPSDLPSLCDTPRSDLCIGGAALAFATGFATAKLRTELARAPVLAHELALRQSDGLRRGPRAARQGTRQDRLASDLPRRSEARTAPLSRARDACPPGTSQVSASARLSRSMPRCSRRRSRSSLAASISPAKRLVRAPRRNRLRHEQGRAARGARHLRHGTSPRWGVGRCAARQGQCPHQGRAAGRDAARSPRPSSPASAAASPRKVTNRCAIQASPTSSPSPACIW